MTPLTVRRAGHHAIVEKSTEHPEHYLWIRVDGRLFFLGVLEKGMTRGDVRRKATDFLSRL